MGSKAALLPPIQSKWGAGPLGGGAAPRPTGAQAPESPAYRILRQHNLVTTKYLIADVNALESRKANSDPWTLAKYNCLSCVFPPVLGYVIYKTLTSSVEVPNGRVALLEDGRGGFEFAGPGVHLINDPFYKVYPNTVPIAEAAIQHGDRGLVCIQQGYIGYATDRGQPVLLPPGLHQWRSPTLRFQYSVELNNSIIRLGPYTLVTVDQGYSAITQDNGKQVILKGGDVYLLAHRNHQFETFISEKVQTDNLPRIAATTADNILLSVDATVNWRIVDVALAAKVSAETMSALDNPTGKDNSLQHIEKLRADVLKQAEASLAAFIGSMNYTDGLDVSAAANVMVAGAPSGAKPISGKDVVPFASPIFDIARLKSAVDHANEVASTYGVSVRSINIISAAPKDEALRTLLAQGAIAASEAQRAETAARGNAKALRISVEAEASAKLIKANAAAGSEVIRAEGSLQAAKLLESSTVASELAKIDKMGSSLGAGANFVFKGGMADAMSVSIMSEGMKGLVNRGK